MIGHPEAVPTASRNERNGTNTLSVGWPPAAIVCVVPSIALASEENALYDGLCVPVESSSPLCHGFPRVAEREPDEHLDVRIVLRDPAAPASHTRPAPRS